MPTLEIHQPAYRLTSNIGISKLEVTEHDHYPKHSPLSQSVTREGNTVQIEIYEDGEGGWLLEVVDEYGNSTVWDYPFQSDKDALDEVIRTIDQEGIGSMIGEPPPQRLAPDDSEQRQLMALSDDELDELDNFLMSDAPSVPTINHSICCMALPSIQQPIPTFFNADNEIEPILTE